MKINWLLVQSVWQLFFYLQANFARWEPPHGRFRFRHPWKQYQKIGASLRSCAYCIETLTGCVDFGIQVIFTTRIRYFSRICVILFTDNLVCCISDIWFLKQSAQRRVHESEFCILKCPKRVVYYSKDYDKITQAGRPSGRDEQCHPRSSKRIQKFSSTAPSVFPSTSWPFQKLRTYQNYWDQRNINHAGPSTGYLSYSSNGNCSNSWANSSHSWRVGIHGQV